MGTLSEKRVLVTGAGQGIGGEIAAQLLAAGCRVALHYHSSRSGAESMAARARESGRKAEAFPADLTREEGATSLVKEASAFLGGLDILVNNAGDLVGRRLLGEIDSAYWQQLIGINVTSMMWVTRQALPFLATAGGASIVNVSSLAGRRGGHPGSLAYSTCKGAVLAFTRALATEAAKDGIRVNAVAPGFIGGTRFHDTHTTRESAADTVASIPLGRAGTAGDVARAAVFLASEYDGFITGATLDINGGVYAA